MTTVIINENQNGLLFKNGKYQKTVGAGKYRLFGGRTMEILEQGKIIDSKYCALDTLLAHPDFAKLVSTVEVGDEQIALHFVNGSFRCAIARPGKYAFRNGGDTHEFRMVDISAPEVPADFPRYILDRMQPSLYKTVEVAAYQKARLFFDNKFVRLLEPGTYAFWNGGVKVDVDFVDTRLLQMDITGQEIMTQDKVALRINFVCSYRITDYVRILTEIDNYVEQLHIAAQLALRDFVGKYRLDEILENKEGLSRFVLARLREKEASLFSPSFFNCSSYRPWVPYITPKTIFCSRLQGTFSWSSGRGSTVNGSLALIPAAISSSITSKRAVITEMPKEVTKWEGPVVSTSLSAPKVSPYITTVFMILAIISPCSPSSIACSSGVSRIRRGAVSVIAVICISFLSVGL